MSTKLSIFSLLFFVNLANGADFKRKQYIKYHTIAQKKSEIAFDKKNKAKEELLKDTEKGATYKESLNKWHKCREIFRNDFNECAEYMQDVENDLEILKETSHYQELIPLLKNAAYYDCIEYGLRYILIKDKKDKGDNRNEKLQEVIDSVSNLYSTIGNSFIESTEDVSEEREKAQEQLRRIVAKVEGSENQESDNQEEE
jgi:hypothetical protein